MIFDPRTGARRSGVPRAGARRPGVSRAGARRPGVSRAGARRPGISRAGALAALLAAFVLAATSTPSTAAEEDTVEAFSSWEATGHIYPTGVEESTFVGVLSGIFYVRSSDDVIEAGLIMCPGTVTINTTDGSQHGSAKCVIVTPESDRVFGSFECDGAYQAGCAGEFTITGGTGSMQGITGGGPIKLQSAFANAALVPGTVIDQSAAGLALWPALSYKLP